jgi:lactoylglutathione lyase
VGKVTRLFHTGVTVSDMDQSLVFYRDGLGLEVEFDRKGGDSPLTKVVLGLPLDHFRVAFLKVPGGNFIELLEYRGLETIPAASRPCDPGGGHVALFVDDLDAVFARLTSLGFHARSGTAGVVTVLTGQSAGAKALYAVDPDGYNVELVQKPAGSTEESWRSQFSPKATAT